VRTPDGSLICTIDATQAAELLRRHLIVPHGTTRHFSALDADGVRLWLRTRAGGSSTTVGPQERTWHRALRGMVR